MQYIQGTNRTQAVLFSESLDQIVDADNEVRLIDLFVESINMQDYHFEMHRNSEGRPAYNPKDLLKLFIYGYLNNIRSSRVLEKECRRNVEVMWLLKQLAPDPAYNVSEFIYDEKNHTYTCPQQQILTTNGHWYKKDRNAPGRKRTAPILVQHFKTTACKQCPVIKLCTKNTRGRGRVIERSEFQHYVDQNKKNIEANPEIYKKRQAIIEHTYGIIKRQWGFYYITTKRGIKRASADVGLMITCFNLRRLFNLIEKNVFFRYLKKLVLILSSLTKQLNQKCRMIFFAPANCYFQNAFFKAA